MMLSGRDLQMRVPRGERKKITILYKMEMCGKFGWMETASCFLLMFRSFSRKLFGDKYYLFWTKLLVLLVRKTQIRSPSITSCTETTESDLVGLTLFYGWGCILICTVGYSHENPLTTTWGVSLKEKLFDIHAQTFFSSITVTGNTDSGFFLRLETRELIERAPDGVRDSAPKTNFRNNASAILHKKYPMSWHSMARTYRYSNIPLTTERRNSEKVLLKNNDRWSMRLRVTSSRTWIQRWFSM